MKKLRLLMMVLAAGLVVGCSSNLKDGLTYLEEEKYTEAVSCFEEEIEQEKNLEEAYRGLGIAYYELGEYASAVTALENALANEAEETASIYQLLAVSSLQQDHYEEALTFYANALSMEDCTEEMKQEILFNEIAIYQLLSDWDTLQKKVDAYVAAYPDDSRMDKTAEFLETR